MSTAHGHRLHWAARSPVHSLPAHVKLIALVAFVLAVVATPSTAVWAFGVYGGLLVVVGSLARVPAGFVLRRTVVEVPFLVFALLLPIVSTGPRTEFLGLSLSESGLLAGWNILVKGTLGVVASILLAATTPGRDLLAGLQRLRLPPLLVEIIAFMIRYADVVTGEMRRMRIARESRGFVAGHLGHVGVIARSAGALFIRSYERGERVHLAMLSRGYAGALPVFDGHLPGTSAWLAALSLPAVAVLVAITAWIVR